MKDASVEHELLRAAHNQALYRDVNERIEDLNKVFDEVASLCGTWVCECADPHCTKMMEMTLEQYEALRAHPHRFAVIRGHEYAKAERVVEDHDQWVVVETFGVAAEVAVQRDPRARAKA